MAKNNTIVIDLDKWQTQTDFARTYISKVTGRPCTVEYVCKLISKGKLNSWKIEQLGLHLVEKR
jgi:hypothetical protein